MATLITGEEVNLNLQDVAREKQTLIRLSDSLIAGIIQDGNTGDIYLWQLQGEQYIYIGDVLISDLGETLRWKFYMSNHKENEARVSNAKSIAEHADLLQHKEMEGFQLEFSTSNKL